MSFYVKRERTPVPPYNRHDVGWVGPIRSARQAEREAQAWRDAAWAASVHPTSPETRAEVRAWERSRVAA